MMCWVEMIIMMMLWSNGMEGMMNVQESQEVVLGEKNRIENQSFGGMAEKRKHSYI